MLLSHLVQQIGRSHHRARAFNIFGFLFFSITLLIRLARHELWRDEVQAWLISASATSFRDLLVVSGEGHPPLWYWVLFPFTSLGSDPSLIKLPTAIFSVATLALVWFYMDVRWLEKVMISASYYLSFEYGIIARGYVLGTFLLFAFAVLNRNVKEHPFAGVLLLGLASLTHIFFAFAASGIAAFVIAAWVREGIPAKRIFAFATIFVAISSFAAITTMLGLPSVPAIVRVASSAAGEANSLTGQILPSAVQALRRIGKVLGQVGLAFTPTFARPDVFFFEAIALCLLFWSFLPNPLSGLAFWLPAICISLLEVTFIGWGARFYGTVYVLFVVLYLINSREMVALPVRGLLLGSMLSGLATFGVTHPYSMGQQAATMIKGLNAQDDYWAAYPDYTGTVSFGILGRSFHSFECDCQITFVKWGARRFEHRPDALQRRIQSFIDAGSDSNIYILVSQVYVDLFRSAIPGNVQIEEVSQTGRAVVETESFVVWRLSKLPR